MAPSLSRAARDRADRRGPVAVIDIGSNSIRLVVFDRLRRTPLPIFNEKVICALGRGLAQSGSLNPEGRVKALVNLRRFRWLLDGMRVSRIDVLATAAVRDAADGAAFVGEVKRQTGFDVAVISGAEEARLAASGVLSGIPTADGVMGDLGGGSLELVGLEQGGFIQQVTLPLGALRIVEAGKARSDARALIQEHLARHPWLTGYRGRGFYAVGGAWRSVAKAHLGLTGHPVHVIQHHAAPAREIGELCTSLGKMRPEQMEELGVSRRRVETLPQAALVLEEIIRTLAPDHVIFSAFGLREGHLFDLLAPDEQALDPLLHAAMEVAVAQQRFGEMGAIAGWVAPLFPGEEANAARLRRATGFLSDLCWHEHPDYRAPHAFTRSLRLQLAGASHVERAMMATALYVRYGGKPGGGDSAQLVDMLGAERLRWSTVLGLGLRLAHTITGGAGDLLSQFRLELSDREVILHVAAQAEELLGDAVDRRMASLAKALQREPRIERASPILAAPG